MDDCCGKPEGCCSSCKGSCGPNCKCSCHAGHHEECEDMGHYFLQLADEAWEEVLKDKIKEYILSTQGKRMTELAKIVAEGNNARWRHKMEKKQGCMNFNEQLGRFFSQSKK